MSDQDPTQILSNATKPGWRTSEFWLAIAGVLASLALAPEPTITGATHELAQHGSVGVIAAAVVAGAYAIGRSMVKASTTKALLAPVPPPIAITSVPASTTRAE